MSAQSADTVPMDDATRKRLRDAADDAIVNGDFVCPYCERRLRSPRFTGHVTVFEALVAHWEAEHSDG
jgi:hypothetical protein